MENLKSAIVTVLGDETTVIELGLAAIAYVYDIKKVAALLLILAIVNACHALFGKK